VPLRNLQWVAAAAIIGFLGNEAAALVRIRTGKRIGSAALVADGLHARVDGLTSLAVLIGAIGVWLGFPLADPIIGALIGVAILFIVRDAATTMWRRLMDAVDPELLDEMEHVTVHVEGVRGVHDARLRWIGHSLWGELHIEVDGGLSTAESHGIAEQVRHALYHALPRLHEITVHVDPCPCPTGDPGTHHALTAHHAAG
jgi:cation diffusion facilitator family transporter